MNVWMLIVLVIGITILTNFLIHSKWVKSAVKIHLRTVFTLFCIGGLVPAHFVLGAGGMYLLLIVPVFLITVLLLIN